MVSLKLEEGKKGAVCRYCQDKTVKRELRCLLQLGGSRGVTLSSAKGKVTNAEALKIRGKRFREDGGSLLGIG